MAILPEMALPLELARFNSRMRDDCDMLPATIVRGVILFPFMPNPRRNHHKYDTMEPLPCKTVSYGLLSSQLLGTGMPLAQLSVCATTYRSVPRLQTDRDLTLLSPFI